MTARGRGPWTVRCHTALAGLLLPMVALAGCAEPPSAMTPPVAAPQTATSATPSTTAVAGVAVTPEPASRFEDDPAVRALRTHYVGLAKSVNLQTGDVPELRRTSTPRRRARNGQVMRVDYGLYYPGPVPFTPLSVRSTAPDTRLVRICVLAEGWGQDRATGRPVNPRRVSLLQATLRQVRGRWLVDRIDAARGSCQDVTIDEVSW